VSCNAALLSFAGHAITNGGKYLVKIAKQAYNGRFSKIKR
jgi:hypothetical protein